MSMIKSHAKRIVIPAAVGLIIASQISSAQAQVRNTYNGAECVAVDPDHAGNLTRDAGISASSPTTVVCPIPKTIFNSTAGVTAAVAASGGTRCHLTSMDVFSQLTNISSTRRTFPGTGISGLEFSIPSSFRGAMQLRCDLQTGDRILNYLVAE